MPGTISTDSASYREAIRQLREAFTQLYPDIMSARRVSVDAALATHLIDFSGSAINCWHNILNEAAKDTSGLQRLLEIARSEYPTHTLLHAAVEEFHTCLQDRTTPVPATLSITSSTTLPPNPFSEILAIRDPVRFIGRSKELTRLQAMLSNGSVALLGEPKIGRSSLLRQLAQRWQGEVIGPLDCHSFEDINDFYNELSQQLALANPEWRTLRTALSGRALLLLLDEFDSAPDWGMNSEHLRRFRSLCDSNRQLHLVTTSRKPLKELFPDGGRGSPAYNFLLPLTLAHLEKHEAQQLLTHPWSQSGTIFDEPTCYNLLALAGTHPFRLQRAAYHHYEYLSDTSYGWQLAYQEDMEHLL